MQTNVICVRFHTLSYTILLCFEHLCEIAYMNKLKQKFESAMKSTAMSAQQIYKHKSFNLSKTQEDPE